MAKKRSAASAKSKPKPRPGPRPRGSALFTSATRGTAISTTPTEITDEQLIDAFVRIHALGVLVGGVGAVVAGAALLGFDNVQGVFFGRKNRTGERALKVLVRKKTNLVAPQALIPPTFRHGNREIPTDVEEMTVVHMILDAQNADDKDMHWAWKEQPVPVPCGYSISLDSEPAAGTLGCLVGVGESDGGSRLCILSNNHVLVDANQGKTTEAHAAGADKVVAPGRLDADFNHLGAPKHVAYLKRFRPIQFNGATNYVDCAVAETDYSVVKPEVGPPDLATRYQVKYAELGDLLHAEERMRVKKWGRTTGFTTGVVTSLLGVVPQIEYNDGGQKKIALFRRQIVIRGDDGPFSRRGDSGSLIVEAESNRPVGLLFAGGTNDNSGATYTFANPIHDVREELQIDSFVSALA